MLIDTFIVASVIGWYFYHQPSISVKQVNLFASAAACAVAATSFILSAGPSEFNQASSILSLVAAVSLTVATLVCGQNDMVISLLYLLASINIGVIHAQVNLLAISTIFGDLAASWMLLPPTIQTQVITHIRGALLVDAFKLVQALKADKQNLFNAYLTENKEQYLAMKRKFYWNPAQKLGLLRAILRMAWDKLLVVHIALIVCKIVEHYQSLLLIQISGTFASGSTSSANFVPLIAMWIITFLLQLVNNYASNTSIYLYNTFNSITDEYFIEHYLKHKSDYDKSKFNMSDLLHYSYIFCNSYARGLQLLVDVVMQCVSVYIIAAKVGWITTLIMFITALFSMCIMYVDSWLNKYKSSIDCNSKGKFTPQEIIENLRTIKQYAWESKLINLANFGTSTNSSLFGKLIGGALDRAVCYGPKIISSLIVLFFINTNDQLTYIEISTLMYEVSSLIGYMRHLENIPIIISDNMSLENYVSGGFKYLDINQTVRKPMLEAKTNAVEINNCSFSWGVGKFKLPSISLSIQQGAFATVVGKVGSGKSSLLSAICGEMPLNDGQSTTYGTIGYVSQKPWIMNATVKDNILFGNEYEEAKYNRAIEACAFADDLKLLPAADMTEIGYKGINLSGGQKARLALARAVYNDADVYILDDILSAVDAHVEKHLVEQVLTGKGILANKTRILVTHAEHIVPLSDMNIVMKDGQIHVDYNQQNKREYMPASDIDSHFAEISKTGDDDINSETDTAEEFKFNIRPEDNVNKHNYSLVWKFIQLSGYGIVALVIGIQFVRVYIQHYLTSMRLQLVSNSSMFMSAAAVWHYIVYDLVLHVLSKELEKQTEWLKNRVWRDTANKKLEMKMLNHIAHANIAEFERLSRHTICQMFQYKINSTVYCMSNALANISFDIFYTITTLLVVLEIPKLLGIATVAIAFLLIKARGYMDFIEEIYFPKLESACNADPNKLIDELIEGHEVTRIHAKVQAFSEKVSTANSYTRSVHHQKNTFWYIIKFADDFLAMLINLLVILHCKYIYGAAAGPGDVEKLQFLCKRLFTSTDSIISQQNGISEGLPDLAKYFAYAEGLKQEALHYIENSRLPANWPEHGQVEFKDYSLRYRDDLDNVLHNLSFKTQKHEKVGIVGRTGAGKSSLTFALLRLVEAASGAIVIDGVDISTIGLYDLRSRISMVPQDPMLLEGTIRANLDPATEYSDAELWEAIGKCQIEDLLNKPDAEGNTGLDTWVEENGRNFSVGQRQLISLCRALLWKRNILILDEATANIDNKTDQLMQEIIRTEFQQCTVLTIAHRLKTVMDSDRIMVMDQGTIAEFDTPQNLLAQPDSQFSQLVKSMKHNEERVHSKI